MMNENTHRTIVKQSLFDLIEKCDIIYDGDMISREKLLVSFSEFLCKNSLDEHNVAIVLHTGSICFDIILFIYAALNNILYGATTAYDFIGKLKVGTRVTYKKSVYEFLGITNSTQPDRWGRIEKFIEDRALLKTVHQDSGHQLDSYAYVSPKDWGKIMPYNGEAKLGNRGILSIGTARNEFLQFVLGDKIILSRIIQSS